MLGTHCSAALLSYVVSSNTSSSDQRAPTPASCGVSTPSLLTNWLISWHAYSFRFLQADKAHMLTNSDILHGQRFYVHHRACQKVSSSGTAAAPSTMHEACAASPPLDQHPPGCLPWLGGEGDLDFGQQVWVAVFPRSLNLLSSRVGCRAAATQTCSNSLLLLSTGLALHTDAPHVSDDQHTLMHHITT
mgnify:CR=1 FL=1